jgi:hypothetical protein
MGGAQHIAQTSSLSGQWKAFPLRFMILTLPGFRQPDSGGAQGVIGFSGPRETACGGT